MSDSSIRVKIRANVKPFLKSLRWMNRRLRILLLKQAFRKWRRGEWREGWRRFKSALRSGL